MKKSLSYIIVLLALCIVSCSKGEYTDAIPANSTAIIQMDPKAMMDANSPFRSLVSSLISDDSEGIKGIDASMPVYIFESADGNIGICASICDEDSFGELLSALHANNTASETKEINDATFSIVNNQWIAGYNSSALLIMGPVVGASEEAKMMKRMSHMLQLDTERSIKSAALWEHLNEAQSPIRMVAQANALPEQMVVAFTIGAPKGTDPSDVLVEADITFSENEILMTGKSCSYNIRVKQEMEKSYKVYRTITTDWTATMNDSIMAGIFMNVDGKEYLPQIQANRALSTMLMGSDAYDRIRDSQGNIAILLQPKMDSKTQELSYAGKVLNLADESYTSIVPQEDRLIVCIDIKALPENMRNTILPFIGNKERITYKVK